MEQIHKQFDDALATASSVGELEELRIRFLGKKGIITSRLKGIGALPADQRPSEGSKLQSLKKHITESLAASLRGLDVVEKADMQFDVSLPARPRMAGNLHPLTSTMDEIVQVFSRMGFSVRQGPEMEDDYHNFEALNFPADHPARDMQDTIYLEDRMMLRTHTSPVQIRVMESSRPPIRCVFPGKTYRHDNDVTHSPVFHQVEGLMVDSDVTFADLKFTLTGFVHAIFGKKAKVRFRPSFFPFTEPSAEMDMACTACDGSGCRVCSHSGWIEILGAGMVDPNVFEFVGYDPDEVSGFAFGMGIERVAMIRHRIDDIRLFYENDFRFLGQFRGGL